MKYFAVKPKWLNAMPLRLELTKEQFEELLVLAELGLWVRESEADIREERADASVEVIDHLWKQAEGLGLADLTKKWHGKVVPKEGFVKQVEGVMEHFLDDEFWDRLETRLGERDFLREATPAEIQTATLSGSFPESLEAYCDKWHLEFDRFGINRLTVEGGK
jgi:hypothetical protein